MRDRAQIGFLPGGSRLHMQDGPIDLVIEAWGAPDEVQTAYRAAARRFVEVLDELCAELSLLRQAVRADGVCPRGPVARRMAAAVAPYRDKIFITPMAAVAGAVAEEILESMTSRACLDKAYVNDGGDIALHLAPGERLVIGMAEGMTEGRAGETNGLWLFGAAGLSANQPIRGIATSGWRGRSFSLGVADAVTVLSDRASTADAAATVVANAVDLPNHPNVLRAPASSLAPDSDLEGRLVTRDVGELSPQEVRCALAAGARKAEELCSEGLVRAVALHLRGETRIVGLAPSNKTAGFAENERRQVHA
jgi:ApbE superfamily uncharacterized protein (UPF0280 family)